jgi:hypothetical protein
VLNLWRDWEFEKLGVVGLMDWLERRIRSEGSSRHSDTYNNNTKEI